jgi:uncharacterized protein with GYD domain
MCGAVVALDAIAWVEGRNTDVGLRRLSTFAAIGGGCGDRTAPATGRLTIMPRYLWQVRYTSEGAQGLLEQGGSARRAAIVEMVESVGGSVEVCYFAFGSADLVVIGELPDEVAAAALSVRTAASGAASSRTLVLLTPEQLDEAVGRDVTYRPPGA